MAGHLRAAAVAVVTFAAAHAVSASAQTVFMNDFNSGLTSSETVSGAFSVADGYLGHHGAFYSNNAVDTYSLSVILPNNSASYLNFDLQYNLEASFDFLRVLVNDVIISPISGPRYDFPAGYTNSGAGRAIFDLSGFSGLTNITLRFTSDGSITYSGVKIDELDVGARTDVAPAVPEIGTWAMMILGMGAIGFAMRRRQKVTTRIAFAA